MPRSPGGRVHLILRGSSDKHEVDRMAESPTHLNEVFMFVIRRVSGGRRAASEVYRTLC